MEIVRKLALIIIALFFLMIWSGIIRNLTLGGNSLGPLSSTVRDFSELTSEMKQVYKHYMIAPDYYLKTPDDFKEINNLQYDLFGLYSFRKGDEFDVELKNFKNDSVIKIWKVPVEELSKHYKVLPNNRLYPAMLLKNREILVSCNEQPGLFRMNSGGDFLWFNTDFIYHHAMNFDHDGKVWIPAVRHEGGTIVPNFISIDGEKRPYRDDLIVQVDPETGKTLFSKSLTSIFIENGKEYMLDKASYPTDPLHLNDIQPVLETSEYMQQGDLFLSFRHISIIVQYRPSTNEIVEVIRGPFSFQHDVDIISPNSIALLDNNTVAIYSEGYQYEFKPTNQSFERKIESSNVVIYNFETSSFKVLYKDVFKENHIFTGAEGLYDIMDNGDMFFEEQGSGIIWVLNANGVILKTVLKSDKEGYHYLPNWTSTYRNVNF